METRPLGQACGRSLPGVPITPGDAGRQVALWLREFDAGGGHGRDERRLRSLYYGALV